MCRFPGIPLEVSGDRSTDPEFRWLLTCNEVYVESPSQDARGCTKAEIEHKGGIPDRQLLVSSGYLVQVEDISVLVRHRCHEATPGLLRRRHREVHSEARQTRDGRQRIRRRRRSVPCRRCSAPVLHSIPPWQWAAQALAWQERPPRRGESCVRSGSRCSRRHSACRRAFLPPRLLAGTSPAWEDEPGHAQRVSVLRLPGIRYRNRARGGRPSDSWIYQEA